jgi:hypothetical protein
MVSVADELLDHLYERLEELRDGVMNRPLRMVGPEQDAETIRTAAIDGTPRQPPPPAGPGEGAQQAPQEEDGPQGGAQPPALPEGPPAGQQAPTAGGDQPAGPEGPPAQPTGPTDGPPATSAMYVGTPEEYLAGAADVAPLFEMAERGARAMLAQGLSATRAKGHQLDEQVKAPIFDTAKGGMWVNGKPITGVAILDTGAMPLLVGPAGMEQMEWTEEDVIPNAVCLGLADGKSTQLQGLTKRTVKFTFNKGGKGETSIAIRAVVTEAPYDFLIGNVILWSLGGVIDSWGYRGTPEFRYRLEWLAGPKLASRREGRVPLCYMRDPVTATPEAQYCMLPAGGEDEQVLGGPEIEAEEFAEMPPLETESEMESEDSKYVDLQPLEYEQYEQERGVRLPSALANQGGEGEQGPGPRVALMVHCCRYLGEVLNSYALMRFKPLVPVMIPPRYEMLRVLGPEE